MSGLQFVDQDDHDFAITNRDGQLEIAVGYYMEEYAFRPTKDEARTIARRLLDWADE